MPLIVKNGPISVKPTATPTGPTRTPTATATATATPTATATGAPSALLYGYETGVEGWASANWEQAGTVSQSSEHATQGSHSLQVNALGGWIVVEPSPALDLTGKTMLKLDIYCATATQVKVSFTSGSGWSWQETGMISLNAGQNTVSVELANLSGAALANPNDVKRIGVYYSAGTYYQDNVRAE
jgi:mannan endo-1,4-beta-mannosidase